MTAGDGTSGRVELKKQITLFHSVSIIVGIIIGSGIFVSPVGILQNVRSAGMSCAMWALCGLVSGLCALCYAELGTTIPQSGGEYIYVRRAFGGLPAFMCLWINFIVICPVNVAAACLIFATYVLRPLYPDCAPPAAGIRLIAALIIVLLIGVNCRSVKWSTKVQVVITASKLVALLMIIIIGFVFLAKGEVENFQDSFKHSDYSAGAIAIAFYSGFWAYGGWSYLNFLTEEIIDPYKNLPRAIIISMVIVTLIYLVANVAYLTILTPVEMLTSSAVAVTFAERTIGFMAWIMPLLIAISVVGSMNGSCLSMSRLFFMGARYGHLPSIMSMINYKTLTPAPSLLGIMVLTLIMQSSENIFYLIETMGFGFSTVLTLVFAGLIYLRWKEPDLPRPIKLPLGLPIMLFFGSVALLVITVYQKPEESLVALLLMGVGIPFYFIGVVWSKPPAIQNKLDSITRVLQKILLVVPQEYGEETWK